MRRKFDFGSRDYVPTCSGNARKPVRQPHILDDGQIVLEITGYTDTDATIAAFADQTDMAFCLSRLAAGDPNYMPDPKAVYADVSNMPDTPIGVLNFIEDMKQKFASLPADSRAMFDNDFNKFMAKVQFSVPDSMLEKPLEPAPVETPSVEKDVVE